MERLSYELAQVLQKNQNIHVETITHRGTRISSPLFVIVSLPRVLWRARHADVIHFGDPLLSLSAWLVKRLVGTPVCVTVHGLDITYPLPLYQWYIRWFLPAFDHYIAISTHVATLLQKKNISARKITVITPAVNDDYFDPSATREQLAKFLPHTLTNSYVLLTSGRLVKRKGHAWFIKNVLSALPSNVVYVIAGEGPERKRIMETAKRAGVANRVQVLNRVSPAVLKLLYNTVDAFVQPNVPVANDPEGFGLVLLEAALCQRPVFAARIGGIPDAIHEDKNGTLLPTQDVTAWQSTLQHFIVHPHRVSEARTYTLRNFGWERTRQNYVEVFLKLTKSDI